MFFTWKLRRCYTAIMRRVWFFILLPCAALLCAGLLYGAYAVARQEAIGNLLTQETILARQAALGIQDHFEHAAHLAETLAETKHIVRLDQAGREHMNAELRESSRGVLAITRMDARGVILYSTPDNSVAGRDVSGQEHVARLLATHRATASDVFTSVQGYRAVALHVPVFEGDSFQGSVALLLNFDAIAKRHLEGVRVAETGYAFVMSQKGVLLYTPVPGLTGKGHLEVSEGFPELRALMERMIRGEAGTGSFRFDRTLDREPAMVVKHASFLPIRLEDTFWSICVATPEAEILAFLKRFGVYLLPLGLVVLLSTAIGVALGLRHFVLEKEVARRTETEAALRESEARYRSVIDNITDVFYRTDAQGRLIMVSPSGLALTGYESLDEVLGRPIESFWRHPEERQRLLDALHEQGFVRDFEVEMVARDGRSIHVATSSNYYRDQEGRVAGVEGVFRDITRRKRDQAALAESKRRFHSLFDNMAEGVALCVLVRDQDGQAVNYRIVEVNRSFEEMFGLQAEDVADRLVTEVFGTSAPPHLAEYVQVAETGQPRRMESFLSAQGKHLSISAGPWLDGGFATLFSDITERKQMEEQLLFRALHDPLTGLANRSLCLDRIAQAGERALRRSGPGFAVVFMDLDRFKLINDSLGHEAGDLLLREVASRLLACTRRVDTVCRYGGDEFALVLEELDQREVLRTLKRIREGLKQPVRILSHSVQVEASFGVAFPPAEPTPPEETLRNANIALHRAKQHGRNRVVVYKPSMHQAAIQLMSLEHDIRRGLARGEFSLLYQPVFDLVTDRLSGFEALLRWQHPTRGAVSPGEFIPAAEESGAIFELGGLALSRGCQDMAALLRASPAAAGLTLSVNLSPRQFSRQGLTDQIDTALASAGLPPKALVLEITESSIMKHPEASAHILARLKARGVGVAIDDFGTGYSSMSVLQRLPLDRLKIDMSFIARMADSSEDREIVRAIITLARSLHLTTVAEGIETEEQRQLLKTLGCELGQGYLCARPLPLDKINELVNPEVCEAPGL